MAALTNSFLAGAPDQLHEIFFNPMNERLRLTTHMYGEHNDVRQIRTVRNAHLIDCTPQPLKSLGNYRGAAAIYLATPVREYLKKHTVLIPGDWPSQFYQRQLAYNEQPDSPLRNTTPTMGPLHVSLIAQENVVCKFIVFFFRHYTVTSSTSSWPTNLNHGVLPFCLNCLLVLGTSYVNLFSTVLVLLRTHNSWPYSTWWTIMHLCLSLSIQFSSRQTISNATTWPCTRFGLCILFSSANTTINHHWCGQQISRIGKILSIRSIPWFVITSTSLMNTQWKIFIASFELARTSTTLHSEYKRRLVGSIAISWNFATWFVPPRRETLSQNKLRSLKIKTAKYLLGKIADICMNAGAAVELPRLVRQPKRTTRWHLPQLLGDGAITNVLLPLGFQFDGYRPVLARLGFPHVNAAPLLHPRQDRRCDYLHCGVPNSPLPTKLHSCGHSFHEACVTAKEFCYLCREGILSAAEEKARTASDAISVLPSARICPYFYGNSTCNPQYGNAVVDSANFEKFQSQTNSVQIDNAACPGDRSVDQLVADQH